MLSWCFSDFLTIDSGLQEVWVTMLSMSVFHWTRRVVSLPSQALRVSVHASLLLPGPDDGDASSAAPSGPSAASSAASSRRCLEAATSYCFLRTVAYLLGCFTFLCSRSVGVKTASLAKVGDGGITTQLGLPLLPSVQLYMCYPCSVVLPVTSSGPASLPVSCPSILNLKLTKQK